MESSTDYSIYIVLAIAIICWLGIFGYLLSLDNKVKKLEKMITKE